MKGKKLPIFMSLAALVAVLTFLPFSVEVGDSHTEHSAVTQAQDPEHYSEPRGQETEQPPHGLRFSMTLPAA